MVANRPDPQDGEIARVLRVDDGDSLVVEIDGRDEKVRLIGINAPERDECLGSESRQTLTELVEGREVLLETDVESRDQFERLLRYVWIDATLVNAELAARGLAIARDFAPNTSRQLSLDTAEASARAAGIGLWDPSACGEVTAGIAVAIIEISADPPGRDEENLNGEYAVLENLGAPVDLSGFVLRDGSSQNRYSFPEGFILNQQVVVYVGCGDNQGTELYWCAAAPVWDNDGDDAYLVAPGGGFVTSFEYP